jgi:HPt (histidine-containing phosphotransfer) domain-containing protein
VPDDQDRVGPAVRRVRPPLPAAALAGLREAFADEVAARLPRLLLLLGGPAAPDAVRDAHALGSSAVVVGEADASRCARALEAELGADSPDRERVAELVRELAARLDAWLPAGHRR